MTQQPDPLFTAIDHVGVAVPDLDAAIAFYRDTYGMRLVHEETNEEQGVREAMMAVGDSGSCVQLLAPLTPQSTIATFLDRSGPGVQQVAYRVEDVVAVSATLRERGMRLLYDEPRRGTAGSRINFVHPKDAGGVLVELVEPAEAALTHLRPVRRQNRQVAEQTGRFAVARQVQARAEPAGLRVSQVTVWRGSHGPTGRCVAATRFAAKDAGRPGPGSTTPCRGDHHASHP